MKAIRKRGLAVCMTILLLLSGFTVSAETLCTGNGGSVHAITVSGGDALADEEITEYTDCYVEKDLLQVEENPGMTGTGDDIASGEEGDITWVIDSTGKLTVEGTGDVRPDLAWGPFCRQIVSAEINVSKMTNASDLFRGCENLESINLSNFDTSRVTKMTNMFYGCTNLKSVDVSNFDTSRVVNMAGMFEGCQSLKVLDCSNFKTYNVRNMSNMFHNCSSLVSLNVRGFNTNNVVDMTNMFRHCTNLTDLDISGFRTANLEDMQYMFCDCSSLKSLNISKFDTGSVYFMTGVFWGCSQLVSLNVSGIDTSNVWWFDSMFSGCSSLKSLDIGEFDTSNASSMASMFSGCSSLTSLNLSGFDTSNVLGMSDMFSDCSSLVYVNLNGVDTGKAQNMRDMFSGCKNLTNLDMSGFDTSGVTDMTGILRGCDSLTTLKTPRNVKLSVALPTTGGNIWYLEDGTAVTKFPQNLDYSITLARKSAPEIPMPTPTISPAPTMEPTPAPTVPPAPTMKPTPAPTMPPVPTTEPTSAPVNPPFGDAARKVRNFVSRMYTVALGREAEAAGLNDWTNRLLSHEIDGAGIADGFIMSDEFRKRGLSDGGYVDTLYRTFFDREADQGGRNNWLSALAAGKSRAYVLSGFVNSSEFDKLCDAYGIVRGNMREDGTPVNAGIRCFVERCYTKVLGRMGEKAGVEDWTGRIATGRMSAEDVAKAFFFSEEYENKNTDNEAFVETLYQTFMDRASDPAGRSDWLGRLERGASRSEVLEGFSRSEEFAEILRSYGL